MALMGLAPSMESTKASRLRAAQAKVAAKRFSSSRPAGRSWCSKRPQMKVANKAPSTDKAMPQSLEDESSARKDEKILEKLCRYRLYIDFLKDFLFRSTSQR